MYINMSTSPPSTYWLDYLLQPIQIPSSSSLWLLFNVMISDAGLNSLAIFLGCLSMLLIVLYHFLEVNAKDKAPSIEKADVKMEEKGKTHPKTGSRT